MKVFWGHTVTTGGAYYRCMSYALEAKKQGLCTPMYIDWDPKKTGNMPNCWERLHLQNESTRAQVAQQIFDLVNYCDLTVFQHVITPLGLALVKASIHEFKKPVLMEIDDYPFDLPTYNMARDWFTQNNEAWKITKAQLAESSGLIVSTNYLKEKFSGMNDNIKVIPNAIDFAIWDSLKHNPKPYRGKVRIGYAAACNHNGDLTVLRHVIPAILDKYPQAEFVFVGQATLPDWFRELKDHVATGRVKVISRFVNIIDYPQQLSDYHFDIGIAPLRDNSFNRAKSNLRYLEYSALKIPTVASDVQPFRETITKGVNGFLVKETSEWIDALGKLIQDAEARKTIGQAANDNVRKNYNLEIVTKEYIDYLEKFKREFKYVNL